MAHLDELDKAILRELQHDARRTNRDVAAAVGVSPTTALDRTRALRKRGVIRKALLDIDLAAIGRPVQALIALRVRPPSRRTIEAFRNWVSALPDTIGVFVVSGSEDFLVHVAVRDVNSLYALVIDELTQRPEIADVRTSVVYEYIRKDTIQPAEQPALGGVRERHAPAEAAPRSSSLPERAAVHRPLRVDDL